MVTISKTILELINRYIEELSKDIVIDKVILFGSYAKGTNNEESDIDIAIFSKDFREETKIENMSFLLIKTSGLGIDLQPQAFTVEDYQNPEGVVKEILNTGIEIKVA